MKNLKSIVVAVALLSALICSLGFEANATFLDDTGITNAAFNALWSTTPTATIIDSPWSVGNISGTITSAVYPGKTGTDAENSFAYTYQLEVTGQSIINPTVVKGFSIPLFLEPILVTGLDWNTGGADTSVHLTDARVGGDVLEDEYDPGGAVAVGFHINPTIFS